MTLLGPRPVIASLSLGATRTFKLKKPANSKSKNASQETYDLFQGDRRPQSLTLLEGSTNTVSCSQEGCCRSLEPGHASESRTHKVLSKVRIQVYNLISVILLPVESTLLLVPLFYLRLHEHN